MFKKNIFMMTSEWYSGDSSSPTVLADILLAYLCMFLHSIFI